MHDQSDAVATAARHVAPASRPLVRKERRIVRPAPRKDLQVASLPRTNVLVVVRWRAGQPLDLPSPAYAATLVLDNVAHLTTDEQFRVLRWLDDVKGRIRVVSTTSDPLWPRVQVGVFNEVLYYRLNTVFVDMGKA